MTLPSVVSVAVLASAIYAYAYAYQSGFYMEYGVVAEEVAPAREAVLTRALVGVAGAGSFTIVAAVLASALYRTWPEMMRSRLLSFFVAILLASGTTILVITLSSRTNSSSTAGPVVAFAAMFAFFIGLVGFVVGAFAEYARSRTSSSTAECRSPRPGSTTTATVVLTPVIVSAMFLVAMFGAYSFDSATRIGARDARNAIAAGLNPGSVETRLQFLADVNLSIGCVRWLGLGSNPLGGHDSRPMQILGTTNGQLFAYDPANGESLRVSLASIAVTISIDSDPPPCE